jgi:hypothetical protein
MIILVSVVEKRNLISDYMQIMSSQSQRAGLIVSIISSPFAPLAMHARVYAVLITGDYPQSYGLPLLQKE